MHMRLLLPGNVDLHYPAGLHKIRLQPMRSHIDTSTPFSSAQQAFKDAGASADRAQSAATDQRADAIRSVSRGQDQLQSQADRGLLVQVSLAG